MFSAKDLNEDKFDREENKTDYEEKENRYEPKVILSAGHF